ncbi:MAG: RtcB family protein [SAR324 cluster bacterium]
MDKASLTRIHEGLWELPRSYRADMRVPARVYADETLLEAMCGDRSLDQLVNVATLPGIVGYALAMPDAHEGYGFPVGGVAAFDAQDGIISPGGIGYDINCGVRLLRSTVSIQDLRPHLRKLGHTLYRSVPSGLGGGGPLTLTGAELDRVLRGGVNRLAELGYAEAEDIRHIESGGVLSDAEPGQVSDNAKRRGADQLGTMGSGNHFVEVGYVERVYDRPAAQSMGLIEGQVTVLIHTGSRGLGHQVATDHIRIMMQTLAQYGLSLPDRELACAPVRSPEGRAYFGAMAAGANFAWANRQLITWEVRNAWQEVLGVPGGTLSVVYDVAHNIAKPETHTVAGNPRDVMVHRKGATRSFPDQPVLIPGSMGTASYVLLGQPGALTETFGSTCHGAGRRMSRTRAKKQFPARELHDRLEEQGIVVDTKSLRDLPEEAPEAYKDVDAVVRVVDMAGIAKKVARLRPAAVIKG